MAGRTEIVSCLGASLSPSCDTSWHAMMQGIHPRYLSTVLPSITRALVRHLTCFPLPSVWDAMRRRVHVPVLLLWGDRDGALGGDLINGIEQVQRTD